MNELRFWLKFLAMCVGLGAFTFYGVMTLGVRGGKVAMPDLRGTHRDLAEHKLARLGLRIEIREERFDEKAPFGVVLQQSEEAGTTIKRGRTVAVIVSRGTKVVAVPELKGMLSSRQARLVLEQNGLGEGNVVAVPSEKPRDSVLAQAPETGVEVGRGSLVSLLLSQGQAPVGRVMPDLRGQTVETARAAVSKMGLVLRKVQEVQQKGATPGAVVAQSLSPGARVEEGQELILKVALGGENATPARLLPLVYQVPADGVVERRVRVTINDSLGQRVVHNAMELPGARVRLDIKVHGPARQTITLGGQTVVDSEFP